MLSSFMKDPPTPNQTLKEMLLDEYGLTIEQAAKMLGISTTSLSNYISGKRKISFDLAYRLDMAEIGTADSWLLLQPSYELSHFVHSKHPKPKVKTKAFKEIREQKQKEVEIANREVDELIEKKLLKMQLEKQKLAKQKRAARKNAVGDSTFDEPAEFTPVNVKHIREHALA